MHIFHHYCAARLKTLGGSSHGGIVANRSSLPPVEKKKKSASCVDKGLRVCLFLLLSFLLFDFGPKL